MKMPSRCPFDCVEAGYGLAEGESLVMVKAQAFGDHSSPQGQDRRTIDRDTVAHGP
jgi:hypothetical protein